MIFPTTRALRVEKLNLLFRAVKQHIGIVRFLALNLLQSMAQASQVAQKIANARPPIPRRANGWERSYGFRSTDRKRLKQAASKNTLLRDQLQLQMGLFSRIPAATALKVEEIIESQVPIASQIFQ